LPFIPTHVCYKNDQRTRLGNSEKGLRASELKDHNALQPRGYQVLYEKGLGKSQSRAEERVQVGFKTVEEENWIALLRRTLENARSKDW